MQELRRTDLKGHSSKAYATGPTSCFHQWYQIGSNRQCLCQQEAILPINLNEKTGISGTPRSVYLVDYCILTLCYC